MHRPDPEAHRPGQALKDEVGITVDRGSPRRRSHRTISSAPAMMGGNPHHARVRPHLIQGAFGNILLNAVTCLWM